MDDAWLDESVTDDRDGLPGQVGYEINFNRFFFRVPEPRSLDQIEADILKLEHQIVQQVEEVTS